MSYTEYLGRLSRLRNTIGWNQQGFRSNVCDHVLCIDSNKEVNVTTETSGRVDVICPWPMWKNPPPPPPLKTTTPTSKGQIPMPPLGNSPPPFGYGSYVHCLDCLLLGSKSSLLGQGFQSSKKKSICLPCYLYSSSVWTLHAGVPCIHLQ